MAKKNQSRWFEQPANEEVRICLRLECLFARVEACLIDPSTYASHTAISTLSHLCNATDRNDLCSKLHSMSVQLLNRIKKLKSDPSIDNSQLDALISVIETDSDALKKNRSRPGERLRQNPFFNSIRQQLNSPNGLAEFDSPQYSLWISQPSEKRIACLQNWLEEFHLLKRVVLRTLELIRGNCQIEKVTTERGLYEQAMDTSQSCLLIRVKINAEGNYYPTISVGKHQSSVQLQKIETVAESMPQRCYEELPLTIHFCYG